MPRPLAVLALVVSLPLAAFADAEEASVHVEAGPVFQRVEDARNQGTTATAPGARLSVRGTWGVSDYVAVEVGLGGTFGTEAEIPGQRLSSTQQNLILHQSEHTFRLTAGATARLGVKWIPTVTGLVGFQHRIIPDAFLADPATGVSAANVSGRNLNDLLLGVGLGHDFRFGEHLIVGFSVQLLHAVSFDGNSFTAIEIPFHIAHYWYPRW